MITATRIIFWFTGAFLLSTTPLGQGWEWWQVIIGAAGAWLMMIVHASFTDGA